MDLQNLELKIGLLQLSSQGKSLEKVRPARAFPLFCTSPTFRPGPSSPSLGLLKEIFTYDLIVVFVDVGVAVGRRHLVAINLLKKNGSVESSSEAREAAAQRKAGSRKNRNYQAVKAIKARTI